MTCFEIRYIQKKGQRQRMEIAKFSWNVIKTGMIKETKHFSRVNAFRAVFTENRKPRLARQKRLGQQETTTPDHHRNRSPPHCSSTRQIEKKKTVLCLSFCVYIAIFCTRAYIRDVSRFSDIFAFQGHLNITRRNCNHNKKGKEKATT